MGGSDTDRDWERWGRQDPYYGVITFDRYRTHNLDATAKAEFFQTGFDHVAHVLAVCRRHFDPGFVPRRALDFGCGVGRLVVPLASVVDDVVGVDISDSMLAEARRNCDERKLGNVTLVKSDDYLSRVTGPFDLIHSFIVLQHIAAGRGLLVVERLVELLADGGIAALHVKYGDRRDLELELRARTGLVGRVRRRAALLRRRVERMRVALSGAASRAADPAMQMNAYPLDQLLFLLQRAGAGTCWIEFTDHNDELELGTFVFFSKGGARPT